MKTTNTFQLDRKHYVYKCECCKRNFKSLVSGRFASTRLCEICLQEVTKEWTNFEAIGLHEFIDAYLVGKELTENG